MSDIQSLSSIQSSATATSHRNIKSGNDDTFSNQLNNTVIKTADGFRQGQLGADLNDAGNISRIIFYDEQGQKLTTSSSDPATLQELSKKFGIDKSQLAAFSQTMLDKGHNNTANNLQSAASETTATALSAQLNPQEDSIQSERLSAEFNSVGNISRIVYFDAQGERLTTSSSDPDTIKELSEKFDISAAQLNSFAAELMNKGHMDVAKNIQQSTADGSMLATSTPKEQDSAATPFSPQAIATIQDSLQKLNGQSNPELAAHLESLLVLMKA